MSSCCNGTSSSNTVKAHLSPGTGEGLEGSNCDHSKCLSRVLNVEEEGADPQCLLMIQVEEEGAEPQCLLMILVVKEGAEP